MNDPEREVLDCLEALGIPYVRHVHPPVATVAEAERYWTDLRGAHCKNLFLRNNKGNRHYLVIAEASRRVDLKALTRTLGEDRLSFASPERLKRYLGLEPGSVSPFGLIHDIGEGRPGRRGRRAQSGREGELPPQRQHGDAGDRLRGFREVPLPVREPAGIRRVLMTARGCEARIGRGRSALQAGTRRVDIPAPRSYNLKVRCPSKSTRRGGSPCRPCCSLLMLCAGSAARRGCPRPRAEDPVRPRFYVCYRVQKPPVIDGRLDEASWKKADWTESFVDIEGPARPKPRFRTRVKMLWDDAYFYVAAELEEPNVWATYREQGFRHLRGELFRGVHRSRRGYPRLLRARDQRPQHDLGPPPSPALPRRRARSGQCLGHPGPEVRDRRQRDAQRSEGQGQGLDGRAGPSLGGPQGVPARQQAPARARGPVAGEFLAGRVPPGRRRTVPM